jgi:Tol biopolymer transport system component
MTADSRFERDLTALLEDLYLGPTPDYRREVLAVATHRRQRPSWTFPGRWLPVADIASRSALVPRVPWRMIAVALLIVALLAAATVVFVASHQTRVPPPFGFAGNGRIAYVNNGDVFLLDPMSGSTTPIITGPAADAQPVFSPDGTRLAFRRSNPANGSPAEDIVVANADGSNPIVITPTPIANGPSDIEWAPDSRSLLVGAPVTGEVRLYDAARAMTPRVIAQGASFPVSPFRPADGASVMLARARGGTAFGEWTAFSLATGKEVDLAPAFPDGGFPRWSPDGTKVVYTGALPANPDAPLLYVVNADGTGAHRVTSEPGIWAEFDPTWSPDGTRIAFNRAERLAPGQPWTVRQTGILTVATGTIATVGPLAKDVRAANPGPLDAGAAADEAYSLDWSPNGRWLLALAQDTIAHPILIDTSSGDSRVLDVILAPGSVAQVWQRTAP